MLKIKKIISLLVIVLIAIGLLMTSNVLANDYPSRRVEMVIPWSPGGGSDALMRVVANHAEKYLDVPMVPVNIAGVGGTVGLREVKNSEPDGYRIVMVHEDVHTAYHTDIIDFNHESFEPIAAITSSPQYIAVNADSEWETFDEFVEYARNNPGDITMGTTMGTIPHFQGGMLEQAADIEFSYAGYEGTGERVVALVGGHVDVIVVDYASSVEYVADDRMRLLAFANEERSPDTPDIPTLKELGYGDEFYSINRGLLAPEGTSEDKLYLLEEVFKQVAEDSEFIEAIERQGAIVRFRGREEYKEYMDDLDDTISELSDILEL